MGGQGSGGRRVGSGKKPTSDLERAVAGTAGKVLQHPNSTAVAPVVTFDPPAELRSPPEELAALMADLASLRRAPQIVELETDVIAELETRVAELQLQAQALAIWHELARHAFAARTLTPATSAAFVMLCRAIAKERSLSASRDCGGPDHRGLMQRIATWMKDFSVAPLGKPMYAAGPAAPANPLARFTQRRA